MLSHFRIFKDILSYFRVFRAQFRFPTIGTREKTPCLPVLGLKLASASSVRFLMASYESFEKMELSFVLNFSENDNPLKRSFVTFHFVSNDASTDPVCDKENKNLEVTERK